MGNKFNVYVECAIEFNGKFLLIKRPENASAGGLLAFPGGGVEYKDGEEKSDILLQAVKREIMEEVGLDLMDPISFVTSSYYVDSNEEHIMGAIFYCELEKTHAKVTPSKREVPEYYWLTTAEILARSNTPPWIKYYLSCLTEHKAHKLNLQPIKLQRSKEKDVSLQSSLD